MRGARWVSSAVMAVMAVAGCSGPSTATHDPSAVRTALRAVRADLCPYQFPSREASDVHGRSLEPLAANRLLVCGYAQQEVRGGIQDLQVRALITDGKAISRFRTSLNRLDNPPGGEHHCPAVTGAAALEIFTDGVHEVELRESLTGCQTVTNGSRTGWIGASNVGTTVMGWLPATFYCAVWNAFPQCRNTMTER